VIRLAHPPTYTEERRYVADVVLGELLGLEVECVAEERDDVELTVAGHNGALCYPDSLFARDAADWLTVRALPAEPLERVDGLPLVYGLDLLGGAFFLLTRYEELVRGERDEHGRFRSDSSLAGREGFLDRPLVNEYAERMWADLRATWPRLERRVRAGRTLPSHDVDIPFCAKQPLTGRLRSAAADVVVRRDIRLAGRRVAQRVDLCDTFDFLMDESERNGVQSAFYVIASHGPANRVAGYSLDDPRIRALLRTIHERGHAIGLHGSYTSHDDPAALTGELATLRRACDAEGIEQAIWGGRQHYLRWSPRLWPAYEAAGLAYDTSVGYADAPGFRAGICCEFPVFDLTARRRCELRERPLVAMEASLLQYLRLGDEEALARLTALKHTCSRFGGDFTLLWHNNRLASQRERRLYRAILAA
jgi:uncharacterized protein DUF7033